MIKSESGFRLVPELYSVPKESVCAEYANPGSQKRIPLGRCPFLWAQSLYVLGKLLQEVCILTFHYRQQSFYNFAYCRVFWRWESWTP